MQKDIPQIIKDVGFDFNWDEKKVWDLDFPIEVIDINDLIWHFDIPFMWYGGEVYNLTPKEVIEKSENLPDQTIEVPKVDEP